MTGQENVAYVRSANFDRPQTRWFDRGLCKGDTEDIWFPNPPNTGWSHDEPKKPRRGRREGSVRQAYAEKVAFAISICNECPVKAECLADAESRDEKHGIWGGRDFYRTRTDKQIAKAS